jgi:hypothetical protein
MSVRVVAVDVGSVSTSKFAWARLTYPEQEPVQTGDDLQSCVDILADALRANEQTALLLEAPGAVPVPGPTTGWHGLGRARTGEENRPWSAGAGAGALATALAQGAWILGELAAILPALAVTTQVGTWRSATAQLLLGEAFVSGSGKPVPVSPAAGHVADATAAAKEFVRRLETGQIDSDVHCGPERPLSLLAAMAHWAGLRIDPTELRYDVLVVKVRPVPSAC